MNGAGALASRRDFVRRAVLGVGGLLGLNAATRSVEANTQPADLTSSVPAALVTTLTLYAQNLSLTAAAPEIGAAAPPTDLVSFNAELTDTVGGQFIGYVQSVGFVSRGPVRRRSPCAPKPRWYCTRLTTAWSPSMESAPTWRTSRTCCGNALFVRRS